jgi:hypothetical protein
MQKFNFDIFPDLFKANFLITTPLAVVGADVDGFIFINFLFAILVSSFNL